MRILGNRILLIPDIPLEATRGGIYLPDQSKEDRNAGLIVEIGDTVDEKFKQRRVLFNRNAKTDMVYEGIPAYLLYVHDVIAILD